ncbi:hypothetical protein DPMN_180908 [Dreissena polymorpha]|uniref:Uncharacterized protein n=1 Tax=Dreissena polymorpha TaxID=45954 RepID=A0A9D4I376_DREPO|nr:hypothetical protein DPMN_180908 [Dreissena polymorpha]
MSPDLSAEIQIDHMLHREEVLPLSKTDTLKEIWKREEFKVNLVNKFQVLEELLRVETI